MLEKLTISVSGYNAHFYHDVEGWCYEISIEDDNGDCLEEVINFETIEEALEDFIESYVNPG